jgi:AcrR family transcriptional regulator
MEAAGELFYREGLHAITADRVADHAGLTKPTIYNLFGSKDALVSETLRRRGEQIRQIIERRAAAHDDPGRKLLEVLQVHADMLTSDGFHGCPLVIAAVQAPDSTEARELAHAHKTWLRGLIAQFARRAGMRSPDVLASSLVLVLEGAAAMSVVQPSDLVAKHARAAARALIAAHTP